MKVKSIIFTIITILIWILSVVFLIFHSNGMLNVSPYGMHNFVNITLQIAIVFLPIIGLILSILINKKNIKYVMILGSLINIYYLSIPFSYSWLAYFEII